MDAFDFEDDATPLDRPKARKNAEKILGAKEIVRRVEWLDHPLVSWAGQPRPLSGAASAAYRTLSDLIAQKLVRRAAGLYAIETVQPPEVKSRQLRVAVVRRRVNPLLNPPFAITGKRAASAAYALKCARNYPRALPAVVGDMAEWLAKKEAALQTVSHALKGASLATATQPAALALEENSWWVGADDLRPSQTLSNEAIKNWLGKTVKERLPGQRLAAVVLGQRRVPLPESPPMAVWHQCGARLSRWPADIVARLPDPAAVARQLAGQPPQNLSLLNSLETALAAQELLWAKPGAPVAAFLIPLLPLLEACDRARAEPQARQERVLNLLKEALGVTPLYCRRAGQWHGPAQSFSDELSQASAQWIQPNDPPGKPPRRKGWQCFRELFAQQLGAPFPVAAAQACESLDAPSRTGAHQVFLQWFNEVVQKAARAPGPEWRVSLAGLAARYAAGASADTVLPGVGAWMECCRERIGPGPEGDRAFRLALFCLEYWGGVAGGSAPHLERLAQHLAGQGPELLATLSPHRYFHWGASSWLSELRDSLWPVGRLGFLPASDLPRLAAYWPVIFMVAQEKPKRLPGLVEFLDRTKCYPGKPDPLQRRYVFHYNSVAGTISFLFTLADDQALASLLGWHQRVCEQHGFTPDLPLGFINDLSMLFDEPCSVKSDFVKRHLWICDRLLEAIQRQVPAVPPQFRKLWGNASSMFTTYAPVVAVAAMWAEAGWGNLAEVVRISIRHVDRMYEKAIQRPGEYFAYFEESVIPHVVKFSDGNLARLRNLIALHWRAWRNSERIEAAWNFLGPHPQLRELLGHGLESVDFVERALKSLGRLGLALQLKPNHQLKTSLRRLETARPSAGLALPADLPAGPRQQLQQIAAWRSFTGEAEPLPSALQKALGLSVQFRQEQQRLEQREQQGDLSDSGRMRLAKLRRLAAAPELMLETMNRERRKHLGKQLLRSGLAALEHLVAKAIEAHWKNILGEPPVNPDDPNWDNALDLYYTVSENKAALRKLLRQEIRKDQSWIIRCPPNQQFLAKVRACGLNAEAWTETFRRTYAFSGKHWLVYAETDALRVLQMGNWFKTCLSVGDINAHSTIANAIEINKRVLYLMDAHDQIIGRKLIGLSPDGVLVGFKSYGGTLSLCDNDTRLDGNLWVKVHFDLACRELASLTGARFEDDCRTAYAKADQLRLFLKWYNDGPEPFDWWVAASEWNVLNPSEQDFERLSDALARRLNPTQATGDPAPELRALAWLGERALPILQAATPRQVPRSIWLSLHRHTQSAAVRRLMEAWLKQIEPPADPPIAP